MDIKKALKEFEANRKAWTEKNPTCSFDKPWGSITRMTPDQVEKGRIYLNPEHRSYLNYGWLEAQDVIDWMEGKPGKVIKSAEHWDELQYICSMNVGMIRFHLKDFNLHPIKYCLYPGQIFHPHGGEREVGKGFPKKMQLPAKKYDYQRMTPEMIQVVEGHIKWMYQDWIRYSGGGREEFLKAWSVPRHLEEEIYGFFYALTLLGLNTQQGACNTPEVRENFSWWKGLLRSEARWQILCEHGLGYQPWIDNKKTLVDRIREEEAAKRGSED